MATERAGLQTEYSAALWLLFVGSRLAALWPRLGRNVPAGMGAHRTTARKHLPLGARTLG